MNELLPSFADELKKIASRRRRKFSGLVTTDADQAQRALEQTQKNPARGPHPALNYQISR